MPAHKQQRTVELSVVLPFGQDGYWQTIRALDATRPWSIVEIYGETIHCSHKQTVHDFVRRLVRGGFAKVVAERDVGRTSPEKLYRLIRRPLEAPSLRRDGSERPPTGQQRMWNAIRCLKQFTVNEIAYTAGLDAPLVRATAGTYVKHLLHAGYLNVMHEKPGSATVYRLKPARNTGPLPPKILRTHIVWDSNRNEVMGGASEASEVTP